MAYQHVPFKSCWKGDTFGDCTQLEQMSPLSPAPRKDRAFVEFGEVGRAGSPRSLVAIVGRLDFVPSAAGNRGKV